MQLPCKYTYFLQLKLFSKPSFSSSTAVYHDSTTAFCGVLMEPPFCLCGELHKNGENVNCPYRCPPFYTRTPRLKASIVTRRSFPLVGGASGNETTYIAAVTVLVSSLALRVRAVGLTQ